ncbi:MAG TPA: hypothetical protein VF835_01060, partial [Rhizomicrobium sp.]
MAEIANSVVTGLAVYVVDFVRRVTVDITPSQSMSVEDGLVYYYPTVPSVAQQGPRYLAGELEVP